jgi:hypothetical protein
LFVTVLSLTKQVRAQNTNIIPLLTIDDQTYTNVELGSVTGSRVAIFYDGGGKRVAISNLPPNLQQRLHYDPEVARSQDVVEAQRRAVSQNRAAAEAREAAVRLANEQGISQYRATLQKQRVGVRGHVLHRLADGSLLVASDGYSSVANYSTPGDPMIENTFNAYSGNCYNGICLVVRPQGHATNAIDGDLIYQVAYSNGNYTYVASGGEKTVRKFCADLEFLVRTHSTTNSMR